MKTINALKLRNNLGEILDQLTESGEPILVSKGRKVRAVLITPEAFEKRFLDYQAEERRKQLLETIRGLKGGRNMEEDSLSALRRLRGYDS